MTKGGGKCSQVQLWPILTPFTELSVSIIGRISDQSYILLNNSRFPSFCIQQRGKIFACVALGNIDPLTLFPPLTESQTSEEYLSPHKSYTCLMGNGHITQHSSFLAYIANIYRYRYSKYGVSPLGRLFVSAALGYTAPFYSPITDLRSPPLAESQRRISTFI